MQNTDSEVSGRPAGWWQRVGVSLYAGLLVVIVTLPAVASDDSSPAGPAPQTVLPAPAVSARPAGTSPDSTPQNRVFRMVTLWTGSAADARRGLLFWQFRSSLDPAGLSERARIGVEPATRAGFDATWAEVSLQLRIGF